MVAVNTASPDAQNPGACPVGIDFLVDRGVSGDFQNKFTAICTKLQLLLEALGEESKRQAPDVSSLQRDMDRVVDSVMTCITYSQYCVDKLYPKFVTEAQNAAAERGDVTQGLEPTMSALIDRGNTDAVINLNRQVDLVKGCAWIDEGVKVVDLNTVVLRIRDVFSSLHENQVRAFDDLGLNFSPFAETIRSYWEMRGISPASMEKLFPSQALAELVPPPV